MVHDCAVAGALATRQTRSTHCESRRTRGQHARWVVNVEHVSRQLQMAVSWSGEQVAFIHQIQGKNQWVVVSNIHGHGSVVVGWACVECILVDEFEVEAAKGVLAGVRGWSSCKRIR